MKDHIYQIWNVKLCNNVLSYLNISYHSDNTYNDVVGTPAWIRIYRLLNKWCYNITCLQDLSWYSSSSVCSYPNLRHYQLLNYTPLPRYQLDLILVAKNATKLWHIVWHLVCVYIVWRDYWFLFGFGFVYMCQLGRLDDAWWRSGNCVCCHLVSAWSGRSVLEWALGEDTLLGYMC